MSDETGRLLLYAPNVHTGGGLVLLKSLLDTWPADSQLIAWLDARAKSNLKLPLYSQIEWITPSVRSRLRGELRLAQEASANDSTLCFHGLPPLLSNKGKLFIFQQNRNYLGLVPLGTFSWATRLRLRFEQTVAYWFRRRCTSYWVQTPSMARALQQWYGDDYAVINIRPFRKSVTTKPLCEIRKFDFIYVADGEAHKNHKRLIEAWVVLACEGIRPTLALTLSERDKKLKSWVDDEIKKHGLNIFHLGKLEHEKVLEECCQSRALIFPSISESFGLPLVEATQIGLPILAAELDFVRDVCVPAQTFDPYSPVSIARAVKRFLLCETPLLEPSGPEVFLSALFNSAAKANQTTV